MDGALLIQDDTFTDAGASRSSASTDPDQRYLNTVARENSRLHLGDVHYHAVVHQYPEVEQLVKSHGVCLGKAPQIEPDAFKGRQDELKELRDKLSSTDISNTQRVVSIVGMGGIGKTQLSLAYARHYAEFYSSIFWVDAKDVNSLEQDFTTLSQLVCPDTPPARPTVNWAKRQIQKIREWFSIETNDRWLLIFDNYDDPDLPGSRSQTGYDIRSYFPFRSHGSIVITTRSTKIAFSKQLPLHPLTDEETSIAILSQRSGTDLSTDSGAPALARRFGGLPLALATAGMYLATAGIDCREYLLLYDTMWTELVASEPETLFEYEERTLSSTWTISLEQVRSQDDDAAKLLDFLAFFSPNSIWFELLSAGNVEDLPWLSRLTKNSIRFQRAMSKLCSFSLVQSLGAGKYQVHPCLHDWLGERLGECPPQDLFIAAVDCVGKTLLRNVSDFVSRRGLTEHVYRLTSARFAGVWDKSTDDIRVLDAAHLIANLFEDYDQQFEAETMYRICLMGKDNILGYDHPSSLDTAFNLAAVYHLRGNLVMAKILYLRAVQGYSKIRGAGDTLTLQAVGALSIIYECMGQGAVAEVYSKQAIPGLSRVILQQSAPSSQEVQILARVLQFGLKRRNEEQNINRERLLWLVYCVMEWGTTSRPLLGLFTILGKALLDIGEDTRNARIAFWYSAWSEKGFDTYLCDGCDCRLTTTTGRSTCRQCPDIDYCNFCLLNRDSTQARGCDCKHSTFFEVTQPDDKDIVDFPDAVVWLNGLIETYKLLDRGEMSEEQSSETTPGS